jgi:agmatine deiminase
VVEEDPLDENYRPLQDNFKRLQHLEDEAGKPLEIVTLPMPPPVYYQGQRLPCSYANFYIANGLVLVPTYGAKSDTAALDTLRRLFPSRAVVGMDATDLVWGLGAFHCVTQQQPLV